MALVNLTTNLKSLRYGKDTVGGGNSAQPFVTTPIPDSLSNVGRTGGPDFLLRGGTLLPKIVFNDVKRISNLFYPGKGDRINTTDPNNPLGVDASRNGRRPINLIGTLFTAKQNVLSLTNVNSSKGYIPYKQEESSTVSSVLGAIGGFIKDNLAINQGLYTPLGTLAQVAGNAVGLHTNKQGLNPFKFKTTKGSENGNNPLGLPTYLNTIATGGDEGNKSRLFGLLNKINEKQDDPNALYSYAGGPGATLGVGKTKITMVSDQRTGINNPKFELKNSRFIPQQFVPKIQIKLDNIFKTSIFNTYRSSIFGFETESGRLFDKFFGIRDDSVYQPGTYLKTDVSKLVSGINGSTSRQVWTQAEIEEKTPFSKTNKSDDITDFRRKLIDSGSTSIPNSLKYISDNKFEQRVNLGNPGKKGNISSYSIGKRDADSNNPNTKKGNSTYIHALDKINAYPLYKSTGVTQDRVKNDFVKFRIGVISNKNPNEKTFIHFRAIIDSMSDTYSSEWESQKFMGRGESFYKYQGFNREISLSWTVAAQSKQELIPMYQKLNYLASATAPSYSEAGYMGGNLISLTIGGWCYEQVGIMSGLTLDVPTESPWEIAIPDGPDGGTVGEEDNKIKSDDSVKEMPMIIKVSGFTFTPIHNFIPEIQKNDYNGAGGFISNYGKQRYIALENKFNNNYSGFNYIPPKVNKN